MDERLEKLIGTAPEMRKKDLEAINGMYPAYLFRKKATRELWTSCCGRHERLEQNSPLMFAEHQREEEKIGRYGGCGGFYPSTPPYKQEKVKCPYCGKEAVLKEVVRCGKGDNLYSFRRVVVLRWYRGALWGLGYSTEKAYRPRIGILTEKPGYRLIRVWRFSPGNVQYAGRDWWYAGSTWHGYMEIDTSRLGYKWKCPDGFSYCAEYGNGYDLIVGDALSKSPWKYCDQKGYLLGTAKPMRFLALCTGYAKQVEMLLKAGMVSAVDDMVLYGKLNKNLFDWNEPNVYKSFGLAKDVLQEWMDGGCSQKVLEAYKRMTKGKIPCCMEDLRELEQRTGVQFERMTQGMARHGLGAERMLHYLVKQTSDKASTRAAAEWWNDYIHAAERIGYDLQNDVFLLPKELQTAHDKATAAYAALKKDTKDEEYRENRLKKLVKRYTFWNDRYLIRPPAGAAEIVAEGKKLKHCVGGYADRHINGKVTILFLRDRQRPGKPLVTIEMNGNRIMQIHGWDDERTGCKENPKREDPRKIYAEFLDEWLCWLEAGSKRKKGYPIIKIKEAIA